MQIRTHCPESVLGRSQRASFSRSPWTLLPPTILATLWIPVGKIGKIWIHGSHGSHGGEVSNKLLNTLISGKPHLGVNKGPVTCGNGCGILLLLLLLVT